LLARYSLLAADFRQGDAVESFIGRVVAHFDAEIHGQSSPAAVLSYIGGELMRIKLIQLTNWWRFIVGRNSSQLSCFLTCLWPSTHDAKLAFFYRWR
jgi:hypothetical protein